MAKTAKKVKTAKLPKRGYRDLQEHLKALDAAGLLVTITEPVNKDTEMHPLVRWQFRGGMPEAERKAFLFTNITDSRGRSFDIPVVIGASSTTLGGTGSFQARAQRGPISSKGTSSPVR